MAQTKKKKTVKKKSVRKNPATKKKKPAVKEKTPVKKSARTTETDPYIGKRAPDFSILTDAGQTLTLSALRGKKVVLYFYPKDDTPGCTIEACDFRDQLEPLKTNGVVVLGVSRDSIESHQKFKKKFRLTFPLLSDTDGSVCNAYGVWQEKNNYGKKYMGIVRTTFLIDSQGIVQKIYPKVKVEGHVNEIIQDVRALTAK